MISEGLLKTKLFTPLPRRGLVERPRLLHKLDAGLAAGASLILVSAPAGFGKTTLIGAWVQDSGLPAAWLTLDEGDNEPVRFWRYVDAALQGLDPRLGEALRPALYSIHVPPIQSLVTALVNDIALLQKAFVLVLDDYHLVENEAIHSSLNFFIDHLPPGAHLVVATRADPPLQLARRRGRAELCEVRAADLRFSQAEAAQLINDVLHLGLASQDIAALAERTEGWIAGLQMAALSLEDAPDRHAFVAAFSGDDRYIADYLIEEVLQRQPVEFQEFLLHTSVLDRLSAPLCNAVTGRSDSQALINLLERANLFLIPLDTRRVWFRYHHLFASLLRQRLAQARGSRYLAELQLRVSRWYAENQYPAEAVEYALACQDYQAAAALIEQYAAHFFVHSELNAIRLWGERLPPEVISAYPRLCLALGWAAHATGYPRLCEFYLDLLEQHIGLTVEEALDPERVDLLDPVQRAAQIEAAVMRARIRIDRLDIVQTYALGAKVLPLLTHSRDSLPYAFNLPSVLRPPLLTILGLAHKFSGDVRQAEAAFSEAAEDAIQNGNIHIVALGLGHLSEVLALQGRPAEAQAACLRALKFAQEYPHTPSAFFGLSSIGLGELAYERDDLDEAHQHFQEGVRLGELWRSWECLLPGYLGLARLHAARQEWDKALLALENLERLGQEHPQQIEPAAAALRAQLDARRGALAAAAAWEARFNPQSGSALPLAREEDFLTAARIRLALGKAALALELLEFSLPGAQADSRGRRVIEILALRGLVRDRLGNKPAALQDLRQALELAHPLGYLRLFLDEGEPMRSLIEDLRLKIKSQGRPSDLLAYLDRLLKGFSPGVSLPPSIHTSKSKTHNLVEPLTPRELEVLQLMARGHSNAQIARQLFLTVNTLKAHTHRIYSKLDVHDRLQAVIRAQELGLL